MSSIGCVVIAGSDKAFAAGADIREMKDKTFTDVYLGNFLATWDKISEFRKPMIAAVSGYCLGGGCELALMCDFIIAADTAKFGQPEITLRRYSRCRRHAKACAVYRQGQGHGHDSHRPPDGGY